MTLRETLVSKTEEMVNTTNDLLSAYSNLSPADQIRYADRLKKSQDKTDSLLAETKKIINERPAKSI